MSAHVGRSVSPVLIFFFTLHLYSSAPSSSFFLFQLSSSLTSSVTSICSFIFLPQRATGLLYCATNNATFVEIITFDHSTTRIEGNACFFFLSATISLQLSPFVCSFGHCFPLWLSLFLAILLYTLPEKKKKKAENRPRFLYPFTTSSVPHVFLPSLLPVWLSHTHTLFSVPLLLSLSFFLFIPCFSFFVLLSTQLSRRYRNRSIWNRRQWKLFLCNFPPFPIFRSSPLPCFPLLCSLSLLVHGNVAYSCEQLQRLLLPWPLQKPWHNKHTVWSWQPQGSAREN